MFDAVNAVSLKIPMERRRVPPSGGRPPTVVDYDRDYTSVDACDKLLDLLRTHHGESRPDLVNLKRRREAFDERQRKRERG